MKLNDPGGLREQQAAEAWHGAVAVSAVRVVRMMNPWLSNQ